MANDRDMSIEHPTYAPARVRPFYLKYLLVEVSCCRLHVMSSQVICVLQTVSFRHWRYMLDIISVLILFSGLAVVVLLQHSCVYVRRSGQFHANQAQDQLDELAKHRTPVCYVL